MNKNEIKQFCNLNGYFAKYSGHIKKWYVSQANENSAKISVEELTKWLNENQVSFEFEFEEVEN